MKQYKEASWFCINTLEECVLELIKEGVKGNYVYSDFNGHRLYSDTVSLDSAYKGVCGMSYYEFELKQKKTRERWKSEEQEHLATLTEQEKYWIEQGEKILDKSKWEEWRKCVPVRLRDLYRGMELKCCLDIIKTINTEGFAEAINVINKQGHSGMSWSLVKSMVRSFSDQGNLFCELLKE